jgi:hypothetical protein
MIEKLAKTKEEYDRCNKFLTDKGSGAMNGTLFIYVEDSANNILAVAGYNQEFGGAIEPLYSDNKFATKDLFAYMRGFITARGHRFIRIRSVDDKVIEIIKELGFTFYNYNEYIKEV